MNFPGFYISLEGRFSQTYSWNSIVPIISCSTVFIDWDICSRVYIVRQFYNYFYKWSLLLFTWKWSPLSHFFLKYVKNLSTLLSAGNQRAPVQHTGLAYSTGQWRRAVRDIWMTALMFARKVTLVIIITPKYRSVLGYIIFFWIFGSGEYMDDGTDFPNPDRVA